MTPDRRRRLVEIMTAMPHEPAFMVSLMNEFRAELTSHARWQIRRLGVWVDRDVIDDLVVDYAVELHSCAAAWRPDGGALPWVWASARLRNVTIESVRPEHMLDRQLPEGFDRADVTTPVWETHDGTVDWKSELDRVGEADERVARIRDAVDRHSDRDVCMLVEFLDRRRSGEPAPGDSAAEVFDVKPAHFAKPSSVFERPFAPPTSTWSFPMSSATASVATSRTRVPMCSRSRRSSPSEPSSTTSQQPDVEHEPDRSSAGSAHLGPTRRHSRATVAAFRGPGISASEGRGRGNHHERYRRRRALRVCRTCGRLR